MGKTKIILIVDDSMSIRRELRMILEKEGYTIREAGNSKMMNLMIKEDKMIVDLVIMDISLKNENGLTLVEHIKENKEYSNIPIIMLTEHTEKENVLTAKSMGVEGFFKKPIEPDELVKRVNQILVDS